MNLAKGIFFVLSLFSSYANSFRCYDNPFPMVRFEFKTDIPETLDIESYPGIGLETLLYHPTKRYVCEPILDVIQYSSATDIYELVIIAYRVQHIAAPLTGMAACKPDFPYVCLIFSGIYSDRRCCCPS